MLTVLTKVSVFSFVIMTTSFSEVPEPARTEQPQILKKSVKKKPAKQTVKAKKPKSLMNKRPKVDKAYSQSKSKLARNYSGYSSRRIKIAGYLGQTYVFGEVVAMDDGHFEGYIYHPANSRTYVYGEKDHDTINLYDSIGNLYQMVSQ